MKSLSHGDQFVAAPSVQPYALEAIVQTDKQPRRGIMLDILFLIITLAFFAGCIGYTLASDRL